MTGEQLAHWIEESTSTVFFGGAGMSTESGIPDFSSAGGLYTTQHDLPFPAEYMLSHSCLVEHPAEFFDFYRTYLVHPRPGPMLVTVPWLPWNEPGKSQQSSPRISTVYTKKLGLVR